MHVSPAEVPSALAVGTMAHTPDTEVGALIQQSSGRAFAAALSLLRNPDEARDAVQEAAVRALGAQASYDRTRPFYPWFHRVLKNLCLDRLRQGERQSKDALDTNRVADGAAVRRDSMEAPEAAYARNERERLVALAMTQLDNDLHDILQLRHFQDLSYEEMADLLEIPLGTVMSRLYRARKALRARVTDLLGPNEGRP